MFTLTLNYCSFGSCWKHCNHNANTSGTRSVNVLCSETLWHRYTIVQPMSRRSQRQMRKLKPVRKKERLTPKRTSQSTNTTGSLFSSRLLWLTDVQRERTLRNSHLSPPFPFPFGMTTGNFYSSPCFGQSGWTCLNLCHKTTQYTSRERDSSGMHRQVSCPGAVQESARILMAWKWGGGVSTSI